MLTYINVKLGACVRVCTIHSVKIKEEKRIASKFTEGESCSLNGLHIDYRACSLQKNCILYTKYIIDYTAFQ